MTTIGLSAKNAILIVEFAKHLYEKDGKPLIDAAAEAARMRLRPIIMTSLAFTFGYYLWHLLQVQGKVVSTLLQQVIGSSGGMLASTFLGYFLCTTVLCLVVKLFHEKAHVLRNR